VNLKYKVVISDCHLSAGRYFEGKYNPHEDFFFDREMVEFIDHFSSGEYGESSPLNPAGGPVDVELVINGDFLDFLNVPFQGEFEEGVTEEIALEKLEAIFRGHPQVMEALKRFASKPNKVITYLIGNHDADLFFEKVQERITRHWDPNGQYPSEKVKVVANVDRLRYEAGLEIRHGNQFEASNQLDFQSPFTQLMNGVRVLNIPWGSIYVMKIINRLKWKRANVDKIRPFKVYAIIGLIFDPIFTVQFLMLSVFYFFKTRIQARSRLYGVKNTANLLSQERNLFLDLDREARQTLAEDPSIHTIVFGHTHLPMHRVYAKGRQYLNTGTWTRMVYLDWRFIGDPFRRTFALIRIQDGEIRAELNEWNGLKSPYQGYWG
jgi:UDP-2,3-diacylglucosamine pyrophosphatase LpxH